MMYVWDLLFILFYLSCEKVTVKIQNLRLRWFFKVRETLFWLQFLSIIIYLYGRPVHNETERMVSFAMMAFTKLIIDAIARNECRIERAKILEKEKNFIDKEK